MSPVTRNEYGTVIGLSPLRRRRLLRLAEPGSGFNHKAFYSQYCYLTAEGLTTWCLGTAFLTPAGLIELSKEGEM